MLFFGVPQTAHAYGCAVPNVFKPNHNADANQMNANFSALVQCMSFLDATNITGPLYASNFKPTTVGQATFGGGQDYTFPGNLALLGATIGGCAYLDASGRIATAVDGANHPLLCLPGGLIPVSQGGTGVAGGWATNKCFYLSGSVFAQRGCGPFAPAAVLPIVIGATPPPTPTPGPTPTPAPPLTAMIERQTTLTRIQNCPNVQTAAGCSIDLYPRVMWSTIISYRFFASTDGGNTWTFTNEATSTDSDVETPTGGTGPTGPDCMQGDGVTYSYCPSGTWTPSAPPGTTGLNFTAPFGAPGQTPSPIPSVTPSPTPSPIPTPTPTPLPAWLAQYSLAAPLAQTYGGTNATGSAWASPAPPFGDALGSNGTTVTWLSSLPSIDRNGLACQGGAHVGTPYCAGIAPATYTWTGIPISIAGGTCAIVTTATQGPCATVNLTVPVYPVTGLAAALSPYRPAAGSLQTDQINDGAVHLYPLSETLGSPNASDVGSAPQTLPYNGTVTPGGGPSLWALSPRSPFFNQGKVGTNTFVYNPSPTHFSVEAVIEQTTLQGNSCGQIVGNDYNWTSFGHCSDTRSTFNGFALRVGDHYNGFTVCSSSACFTAAGPTWVANTIYHVVGVFTGSAVQLYVNGTLFSSTAFTGSYQNSTGVPWTVGGDQNNNAQFAFLGYLSNVASYDVALTGTQVAQHYADLNGSPAGVPIAATCLVREEDAQYPMFYAAQWFGGSTVSLNVWNSTGHAMAGAYTATVGLACWGSWVNGF